MTPKPNLTAPAPIPAPTMATPPTAPVTPKGPMPDVTGPAAEGDNITITLKMTRVEAQQVIEAMHEVGLDSIAAMFEKAIEPPKDPAEANNTPEALQNDIVAMQPRN